MTKTFLHLPVPRSINTSSHDLSEDFFIPVLKHATTYDRGVGYFSSGWLRINAVGLTDFASNGGKARWITSPILSKDDWRALKRGDEARQNEILRDALSLEIASLSETLETNTRSALAWMVADGLLEFRLATLRGKLDGDFHDKFGIFTDFEGNQLSFSGSYNESIQGTRNYDAFKIFKSWIPDQREWVEEDRQRFEALWNNMDPNVRVLTIGESNKLNIIQLKSNRRPYRSVKPTVTEEEKLTITPTIQESSKQEINLHPYQEQAIQAWFENGCQGFFEMATGTGKTFTSLAGAKRLQGREEKLVVIVAVPYQHLVEQWQQEAIKFSFKPLLAFKSHQIWLNSLNKSIVEFNSGFRKIVFVITTHDTFATPHFQSTIARVKGPSLLIADEAHHLGSETAQQFYPLQIPYRLALSATPNRWYDDVGTQVLRKYFGQTVFEFTLGQAIGVSLTPYYYYPVLVDLTETEILTYEKLSVDIARLASNPKANNQEERLRILLQRRADILNKASNKLNVLSKLLLTNPIKKHTLFYCAPGQLDDVIRDVGRYHENLIHPFTYNENTELRKELLNDFASGKIEALAAIKCLDEGVDVPNTETAYLLASTSNPREFIQRRGRILRRAEGKACSYLYDLITVPPDIQLRQASSELFQIERGIVRKELNRFKEFAEYALNKHSAIDVIWNMAKQYHLIDF